MTGDVIADFVSAAVRGSEQDIVITDRMFKETPLGGGGERANGDKINLLTSVFSSGQIISAVPPRR